MPSVGCKILLWSFAVIWTFSHHTAESAKRRTCGHNSVYMHHRFRVVGGRISERGMWPWQIGIYYINYKGASVFLCGGALVSRLWALTAAHCFYDRRGNFHGNASMYRIKAGDHNLSIYETSQQQIAPEMIIAHHEYKDSFFVDGDIALIKLSRKVLLNRFVKTVCLPEEDEGDLAIPHTNGTVAGWGITRNLTYEELKNASNHKSSKVLRHADIEIQSDHLCLNKAVLTYNSTMTFCAGDGKGGSDACKGDSGGAFVRQIRRGRVLKHWIAVGVVSWGYGCAQKDQYGYYTRVYPFIGWIKKTINDTCKQGLQINEADLECVDINECDIRNGGCPRIYGECVNTHGSYYCKCQPGFQLHESRYRSFDWIRRRWFYKSRKTCRDINECLRRYKGGCSHGCVNTLGSFRCTCPTCFYLIKERKCQEITTITSCLKLNKEDEFKLVKEGGCYYTPSRLWNYRCTFKSELSGCPIDYCCDPVCGE